MNAPMSKAAKKVISRFGSEISTKVLPLFENTACNGIRSFIQKSFSDIFFFFSYALWHIFYYSRRVCEIRSKCWFGIRRWIVNPLYCTFY